MSLRLRQGTFPKAEGSNSSILLNGGIGNQLFQYCFARRIAQEIDAPVYLDTTLLSLSHRNSNSRPTIEELDIESVGWIDNTSAINRLLSRVSVSFSTYSNQRYINRILESQELDKCMVFMQGKSVIDKSIRPKQNSIYIGSFASYWYWKDYSFTLLREVGQLLNQHVKRLGSSCAQSRHELVIHARRGDYFHNPKTRGVHGVYGVSYYLKALSALSDEYLCNLKILSDDLTFALELCDSIHKVYPRMEISISNTTDPFVLLSEFSNTKAFIGSNSTFSWWLANLGDEKVRLLPSKWFNSSAFSFRKDEYFPYPVQFIDDSFE